MSKKKLKTDTRNYQDYIINLLIHIALKKKKIKRRLSTPLRIIKGEQLIIHITSLMST